MCWQWKGHPEDEVPRCTCLWLGWHRGLPTPVTFYTWPVVPTLLMSVQPPTAMPAERQEVRRKHTWPLKSQAWNGRWQVYVTGQNKDMAKPKSRDKFCPK